MQVTYVSKYKASFDTTQENTASGIELNPVLPVVFSNQDTGNMHLVVDIHAYSPHHPRNQLSNLKTSQKLR